MSNSTPATKAASILTGESDVLANVIANQWSDSSLFAYAEWLVDRGDPRGAFLRSFVAAFGAPVTAIPTAEDFPAAWLDLSGITMLRLLRECELSSRRQDIANLARTTLLIKTEDWSDDNAPIGATKFGGCPDLPESVGWPVCAKGSLAFLAQFRLGDIATTQVARRLPALGMLYFFIFNDADFGWAGPGLRLPPTTDTDTIRVIHCEDLSHLRRIAAPSDLGEFNQVAPTRRLTFIESLDFPECPRIDGSDDLFKGFLKREGAFRTTNHFFGYPVYYRMDEPTVFRTDFVHLITFQNAGELPFAWGDDSDLYFYIRECDLQVAKFDSVAIYED